MDPAPAPVVRADPVRVPPHALQQSRPRPDLAARHGGGPGLVPRPVAQSRGGDTPLRRATRALATRPLAALPAADAAYARLGGAADHLRARRAALARLPHVGH